MRWLGGIYDSVDMSLNKLQEIMGFPCSTSGKERACQCRTHKRCGLVPRVGKIPWKKNGNPLQYSWQENPMDRGATIHGVAKRHDWSNCLHTHTMSSTSVWLYFNMAQLDRWQDQTQPFLLGASRADTTWRSFTLLPSTHIGCELWPHRPCFNLLCILA